MVVAEGGTDWRILWDGLDRVSPQVAALCPKKKPGQAAPAVIFSKKFLIEPRFLRALRGSFVIHHCGRPGGIFFAHNSS